MIRRAPMKVEMSGADLIESGTECRSVQGEWRQKAVGDGSEVQPVNSERDGLCCSAGCLAGCSAVVRNHRRTVETPVETSKRKKKMPKRRLMLVSRARSRASTDFRWDLSTNGRRVRQKPATAWPTTDRSTRRLVCGVHLNRKSSYLHGQLRFSLSFFLDSPDSADSSDSMHRPPSFSL
jgi:hypothetical protein